MLIGSGYDLSGGEGGAEALGAQGVLRKPFRMAELSEAVAALLGSRAED